MANAYRVAAGKYVSYMHPSNPVRWQVVRIASVVDQTHCVLEIESFQTGTKVVTALNSGVAVAKRTAHGQTNVWRPY
jgi:hypothetical protein